MQPFALSSRLPLSRKELSYSMRWLPLIPSWQGKSSSGSVMLNPPERSSDKSKSVCPSAAVSKKLPVWLKFLAESVVLGYRYLIAIGELDFWSLAHSEFKGERWVDLVYLRCSFAHSWFSYWDFLSDKGKIFLRIKCFMSRSYIVPVASFLGQLRRTRCAKIGL